jgi:hypothetical protein
MSSDGLLPPPEGFVVAMRASISNPQAATRREWIIASRWGFGGLYLSIGLTMAPARMDAAAPIDLVPRRSALALLTPTAGRHPAAFGLATRIPPAMTLAGRFLPAQGNISLQDDNGSLRLSIQAMCDCAAQPWHVEAVRVPWVGEFIEAPPPRR